MPNTAWTNVDLYFEQALGGGDPALTAALAASRRAGLPAIAVSPNQGKALMLMAKMIGARRILEIGALGGYSTIWLARALPEDGRIVSLEVDSHHAAVARDNLARAGFANRAEVRNGRAIDTLPMLEAEKGDPFDFVFIDADKPSNPDYFAWAMKLSRPGGVVVIDNVARAGAVTDADSQDSAVLGVRRLVEQIAADSRVEAAALQTVGEKGWDGFIVARIKA